MAQSNKRSATAAFDEDSKNAHKHQKKLKQRSDLKKASSSDAVQPTSKNLPTSLSTSNKDKSTKPNDSSQDSNLQVVLTSSKKIKPRESKNIEKSVRSDGKKHRKEGSRKSQQVKVHNEKTSKSQDVQKSWSLSNSVGGAFINHDPILTADGQYVVLPTSNEVGVYSTSTSLLVRSLQLPDTSLVTGSCISASDSDNILVATRNGQVLKYNWTTGVKLARWHTQSALYSITSIVQNSPEDHFLGINSVKDGQDQLILYSTQSSTKKTKSTVLLHDTKFHKQVITSPDASKVTVCGNDYIYFGEIDSTAEESQERSYTWRKLPAPGSMTSFDVRLSSPEKKPNKNTLIVDLVVGLENGSMFIYQDILSRLIRHEKGGQKVDLSGRKLHWHRSHVRSLKWSRDGNYVISGGDESVLVIWQLETNRQQFLPHLSTSVLNITVSTSGSEYALRLGDNSVMILSTADLLPSTNIAGLLLPSDCQNQSSMTLHPTIPSRLLSAVPIRFAGHPKHLNVGATHLQTFDIDANLQLNRQALTRNVTTTINIAPSGQSLQEPHITHFKVSNDGQWLATVDRWSPNTKDIQSLYLNEDDQVAKQALTETVLRFWSWDQDSDSWEVVTRIDKPHTPSKYSVLDLANSPSSLVFTTMGDDGWIKVWQPRRRIRDGIQVRDKNGKPLSTWICSRSIQIEKNSIDVSSPVSHSGTLTYSEDGSVLAASWSNEQRQVHLIDIQTGKLCLSQSDLLSEGQSSVLICGRHLLCLSPVSFKIFDTITLQVIFTLNLNQSQSNLMAVNSRSNTVAVALNQQLPEKRPTSSISVFDLENPDKGPLQDFELNSSVRSLLSEPLGRSFVVIDSECRVRKILPPNTALNTTSTSTSTATALIKSSSDLETSEVGRNLDNIFGSGQESTRNRQKMIQDVEDSVGGTGDGVGGVRNLSELFSSPTTAGQMGVREMFDRVARTVAQSVSV